MHFVFLFFIVLVFRLALSSVVFSPEGGDREGARFPYFFTLQRYKVSLKLPNRDVPLVSPSAGCGFSVSGKGGIVSVFGGMVFSIQYSVLLQPIFIPIPFR